MLRILRTTEIPAIVIMMGTQVWHIPIVQCQYGHRHLDPDMCANFFGNLHLRIQDYVLISVMHAHEVRVIVFDAMDSGERLYDWL